MGIFSSLKGKIEQRLDPQKAIMVVIVAALKADGRVEDNEVKQIRSICAWSPIYSSNSKDEDTELMNFADDFTDKEGIVSSIVIAAKSLSPALRETAFCFATRVILADGSVGDGEINFLEGLARDLAIGEEKAGQIIDVIATMSNGPAA